jgi:starvation-inducible DNA-binding protein
MFKTKNDLGEGTRVKAVELLNARLADCNDLQTQAKQAHWNVKGPSFIALHELFDKANEAVEDYVDDIAERAVQLGGVAEGTACTAARRSSLAEYPGQRGGRPQPRRGPVVGPGGLRQGGAAGHRRGRRAGRPGHGRPVHRGVARHRQVAVVRRGPPPGRAVDQRQPSRSYQFCCPPAPPRKSAGREAGKACYRIVPDAHFLAPLTVSNVRARGKES